VSTTDFRSLQARNRRATWALVLGSFLLLALVASIVAIVAFGGLFAALIAIVLAGITSFVSYRSSDTLALRATGARPADPEEFRQLHNVVEEMAIAAGVPKPRVYVVDDPAPNAFATGRDPENAAIAATTGLLAKMDRTELTGVIAHEMAMYAISTSGS
jgi:heat shock protein HtpX